jgi:hypothetical protein
VRAILPEHLRDRVRLMPCPTTVLADLTSVPRRPPHERARRVCLNVPVDRAELRYGTDVDATLRRLTRALAASLRDDDVVTLAVHCPEDVYAATWLRQAGVRFDVVDLAPFDAPTIVGFYGRQDLVVGGRGHAQLIPFGVQTPLVGLVSHVKSRSFLDDVGLSDWGVDVNAAGFDDQLATLLRDFDVAAARERLASAYGTNRDRFFAAVAAMNSAIGTLA